MHLLKDRVISGINGEPGFLLFVLICNLCRACAKKYLILTGSRDTLKLTDDFYGFLLGIRNNYSLLYMQAPSK